VCLREDTKGRGGEKKKEDREGESKGRESDGSRQLLFAKQEEERPTPNAQPSVLPRSRADLFERLNTAIGRPGGRKRRIENKGGNAATSDERRATNGRHAKNARRLGRVVLLVTINHPPHPLAGSADGTLSRLIATAASAPTITPPTFAGGPSE
jgi:hypothetical protein